MGLAPVNSGMNFIAIGSIGYLGLVMVIIKFF